MLASRFDGSGNDWPRLFEANRSLPNDPDRIFLRQVLQFRKAGNA